MKRRELEVLYDKYYRSLFLYALSLTKSREDAEDLVSDTFIRAWLSYRPGKGDIFKWMMIVLKNRFIDQYRRKHHVVDNGGELLEWVQDPYDALAEYIREERQRWIYRQIYAMPQKQRDIMLLTASTDLSDAEIAEIVELTAGHVRVIKHRARKELAELAKKEGYL